MLPPDAFSPKRLVAHSDLQPSVKARALVMLEAGGVTEGRVNPRDSRSHVLHVTERGRAVSEYVEQLYVEDIVDSLAFLSDDQIVGLSTDIDRLQRIVDDLTRKQKDRGGRPMASGEGEAGA